MKTAINNLSKQNPLLLAAGAALVAWVVYSLIRKTIGDAAGAAGGIFSGNNAATKDTAYEGKGVLGTLGGVVDKVTGGGGSAVGGWIAGLLSSDVPVDTLDYIVTFPDGARHAVPSKSVASDGTFAYKGTRYMIGTQGTQRVARVAA